MSLIEQQRQSANAVLDKLRCLDSRAIIAGGAPRDWYFSKLANDIDIFYYHEQGKWCLDNIGKQIKILQILLGVEDITLISSFHVSISAQTFNLFSIVFYTTIFISIRQCC